MYLLFILRLPGSFRPLAGNPCRKLRQAIQRKFSARSPASVQRHLMLYNTRSYMTTSFCCVAAAAAAWQKNHRRHNVTIAAIQRQLKSIAPRSRRSLSSIGYPTITTLQFCLHLHWTQNFSADEREKLRSTNTAASLEYRELVQYIQKQGSPLVPRDHGPLG